VLFVVDVAGLVPRCRWIEQNKEIEGVQFSVIHNITFLQFPVVVISVIMAARSYAAHRPFCFTAVVLVLIFVFCRLISDVTWLIIIKLCQMFDRFITFGQ